MSNTKENIFNIQKMLYVWLSNYDKRNLEVIKTNCDYLNESYELQLSNPIWSIFWPLVFNGLVDYVENGYYAVTKPVIIDCKTHFYCVNFKPQCRSEETSMVGIYYSESKPTESNVKTIIHNSLPVLKQMPAINEVVGSFPKTLQDETALEYYNWKRKRGIAKLEKEGLVRYFSIPEKLFIRELPSRNIHPEAFAIAYCLSRAINNEGNGRYVQANQTLYLPTFALPFCIYRLLLLDSMKTGILPQNIGKEYEFNGISPEMVKELNRILCNSIRYE